MTEWRRKTWSRLAASSLMAVLLASCGVLVGNPDQPGGGGAGGTTGSVVLGQVEGAKVDVYELKGNGERGRLLASATSGANGVFALPTEFPRAVVFVATGGRYVDEATGEDVSLDEELESYVPSNAKLGHIGINALTTIAADRVRYLYPTEGENAIVEAREDVEHIFGIEGIDIVATRPDNLTADEPDDDTTSPASRLGLVMAAFSQAASDGGLEAAELASLARAMAEDFADGGFDALKDGKPLKKATTLSPFDALKNFGQAMKNFADGPRNKSKVRGSELDPKLPEPPKSPGRHRSGKSENQ